MSPSWDTSQYLSPPTSPTTAPSIVADSMNRSRTNSRLSFSTLRSRSSIHAPSTAPSSFYAALASDPPREEDFEYPNSSRYDVDEWFAGFRSLLDGDSDEMPSSQAMKTASETKVYDAEGKPHSFKSLYVGPDGAGMMWGDRTLIVFIRHFYCEACESYVSTLNSSLPSLLPSRDSTSPTTSIILISCGQPRLIKPYINRTGCPFPIYADPDLKLFKTLGCKRWGGLSWGKQTNYTRHTTATKYAMSGIATMVKANFSDAYKEPSPPSTRSSDDLSNDTVEPSSRRGSSRSIPSISADTNTASNGTNSNRIKTCTTNLKRRISLDGLRGGPMLQVGGEFLYEDGMLVWCHRMRNIRDHAQIETIRRVLDIPSEQEEQGQAANAEKLQLPKMTKGERQVSAQPATRRQDRRTFWRRGGDSTALKEEEESSREASRLRHVGGQTTARQDHVEIQKRPVEGDQEKAKSNSDGRPSSTLRQGSRSTSSDSDRIIDRPRPHRESPIRGVRVEEPVVS